MNYYHGSMMLISNNDQYSSLFKTHCGCRQGGTISPMLFSLYVEPLIEKLERENLGIQFEHITIEVVMYADDIMLLSNIKSDLNKLLKIVEEYGYNYGMKFNPEKTMFMVFGDKILMNLANNTLDGNQANLMLEGKLITRVPNMRYLGVQISETGKVEKHLNNRKQKTHSAIAKIISSGLFNDSMSPSTKAQIFKTFIRPVFHYGLDCNFLNLTQTKEVCTLEGNIIKRALYVPTRCHTTDLVSALRITSCADYMKYTKQSLLIRLANNQFTNELLKISLDSDMVDDFTSEIIALNDVECDVLSLENLLEESLKQVADYKSNMKRSNKFADNKTVESLRSLMQKNDGNMPTSIFDLIHF